MEYAIYKYAAIVGCTLVLVQVVLQVVGLGGDHDVDVHADADVDAPDSNFDSVDGHGNLFFGVLSFKALCAFAGIFGLTGLTAVERDVGQVARIAIASGAGFLGMLGVAWLMRSFSRLQASGSINIRNAVGRTGTVYLRIPEAGAGQGKVLLEIQGRSMEFPAITDGETIQTGARVTVASVEGGEVLKVTTVQGGGA